MQALPQQPVRTPKYNGQNKPKQWVNKDFFFILQDGKRKTNIRLKWQESPFLTSCLPSCVPKSSQMYFKDWETKPVDLK